MRISRLELQQIACFDHLCIDFKEGTNPDKADVHLLVGANGTGKSTLLMAMAQFFEQHHATGLEKRFVGRESAAVLTTSNGEVHAITTQERKEALRPEGVNWKLHNSSPFGFKWHSTSESLAEYSAQATAGSAKQFDEHKFSFAAFGYSGFRSTQPSALAAIQEQTEPPLRNALRFDNPTASKDLVQWIANTKAKEAFARNRGDTEKANQKQEAAARIERTIAQIIDGPFSFVLNEDPLKVLVQTEAPPMEMDLLPDGLKSILSWVADLLMRLDRTPWEDDRPVLERPFLLFLDEIEVHLHPAWQRRILPAIQNLFPNAQVFISTHSPFVIASADDAWIYSLVRRGPSSTLAETIPSMKGNSYATILKDALGVTAEFSAQVEDLLTQFYKARDEALKGKSAAMDEMHLLKDRLADFGEEVTAIVVPELQQTIRRIDNAGGASR